MSLTQRQKAFIRKNYPEKTVSQIAGELNADPVEIEKFIEKEGLWLDPRKKRIFIAIAVSLPFLFFLLLEAGLRLGNYMGDTGLFTSVTVYETEYLYPSRNFTARYFFYTRTLPDPPRDLFLKEKPDNGFRVFMMGGSTAAGYPYGYNALPARVVRDALEDVMPGRNVEVITVATSAINTYTLYDQVDEILAHDPDLVLIYSGHNEYYGALGVGSNERIGNYPRFVRSYLKLQRLKTFLLFREAVTGTTRWLAAKAGTDQADPGGTLMERIVREQSIPLNSELYEQGKHQFESNLREIVKRFSDSGLPVMIGSLVSNLKDQAPFISGSDSADEMYRLGREQYANGDYANAYATLRHARDLDMLKFRAPSEFNSIIQKITDQTPAHYVPVKENFREYSPGNIPGNELMLEHLHPNSLGYFLMGKSFINALNENDFFGMADFPERLKPVEEYRQEMYLSEFDERISYHRIRTLMEGWPFVLNRTERSYTAGYTPENRADSLAFEMVHNRYGWDRAKVELAAYYRGQNQYDRALLEYYGLIRNEPWNDSAYIFASRVYLNFNDFDNAYPLLEQAYEINPNDAFTTKMLGAIETDRNNLDRGIKLLNRSLELAPGDPQALFNLSGAYGLNREFEKAMEVSDRLMEVAPDYPGARSWRQQLEQILNL